ncbi:PRC-barrel domain-containing protein [Pelobium manganitolerans]|uniref:PRC-barrel domain-containing protein n=1 Tax=Pelobium manganitolerans TaxID=1842495 RepID=UPI003FA376AD
MQTGKNKTQITANTEMNSYFSVIGWQVYTANKIRIGTVKDVLLNKETPGIAYLNLTPDKNFAEESSESILNGADNFTANDGVNPFLIPLHLVKIFPDKEEIHCLSDDLANQIDDQQALGEDEGLHLTIGKYTPHFNSAEDQFPDYVYDKNGIKRR